MKVQRENDLLFFLEYHVFYLIFRFLLIVKRYGMNLKIILQESANRSIEENKIDIHYENRRAQTGRFQIRAQNSRA